MTQHLLYLHVQSFWFYWGNHLLSMLPVNSINTLRNSSDKDIPCSTGCGWLWGQRSVMAPRAYGKSSHKAEMGTHIKALGNLCSTNLGGISGYTPLRVYAALLRSRVSSSGKVAFAVLEHQFCGWHTFGKAWFQPLLRPACSPHWEPCSWCSVSLLVPGDTTKKPGQNEPRVGENT